MNSHCGLRIGQGVARPETEPETLFLTVPDAKGTYTVPYIQSSQELCVSADFGGSAPHSIELVLAGTAGEAMQAALSLRSQQTSFTGLARGEYSLEATGLGSAGEVLFRSTYRRIGIGLIAAALGDSITEGYYGNGFCGTEHLTAAQFPQEAVSRDGRNFPQFAPTSHVHYPEVNCFQSWMTDLNDLVSDSLGGPVLAANEGWGGFTGADYLNMMETDRNWQERMSFLRPQLWLLHLGVNDERARVPASVFERNMAGIVSILIGRYDASPDLILLARPSYDYAEGAEECLLEYCDRIESLVSRLGLSHGADLFAAFSRDRERYYGDDPVHPNVQGVRRIAEAWHEAIVKALRNQQATV